MIERSARVETLEVSWFAGRVSEPLIVFLPAGIIESVQKTPPQKRSTALENFPDRYV